MKMLSKLFLTSAALVGAGASQAAVINNLPNAPGGSDLVLFVTDTSNAAYFVQDLGVNIDSLGVTQASVAADAAAGNFYNTVDGTGPGSLNNPVAVSGLLDSSGIDQTLLTFLNAHAGDHFYYSILGANTGNGSQTAGQGRSVQTYDATQGPNLFANADTSSNAANSAQQTGAWFAGLNNGSASGYKAPSGLGQNAGGGFGLGFNNGAALGTATDLYEIATMGGTAASAASIYASTTDIIVGTDGSIKGFVAATTPVPLPAAIWLLGSGLLGMFGIGRRRNTAQTAA